MPDPGFGGAADVGPDGGNASGGGSSGGFDGGDSGGNVDANNNGFVDVTGMTTESGGVVDSGMDVPGFSGLGPGDTSVETVPLFDLYTQNVLNQEAISMAQAKAEEDNASFFGALAGMLGFNQEASTSRPGDIETTFSVNPLSFGLGLINPALGYGVKSTGLLDNFDFEIARWGKNTAPSGRGRGGVAADLSGDLSGAGVSLPKISDKTDPFGSWDTSGVGLEGVSSAFADPQAGAGAFDLSPDIRTSGDAGTEIAMLQRQKPSALPAIIGLAALAVELS